MSTADRPLVILLDGLNQLSVDHRADRLNWLPSALPTSVHLVLSTTTDHVTFHALRSKTGALHYHGGWYQQTPSSCGSVAEWLACWTQAQKGPGSNRSRDAVG